MHSLFDGSMLILLVALHLNVVNAFIRILECLESVVNRNDYDTQSCKLEFSAFVVLCKNVECFMATKKVRMI